MFKNKQVKDYTPNIFDSVDFSMLNFANNFNFSDTVTLKSLLYDHYENFFLVYSLQKEIREIQSEIYIQSAYLNELYATTQYEYNPINNYDMTETGNDTHTITHTLTKNETGTKNETRNLTTDDNTTRDLQTSDNGTITDERAGTTTESNETIETRDLTTGDNTTRNLHGTDAGTITDLHTGTDNTTHSKNTDITGKVYPMNGTTSKNKTATDGAETGSDNTTKNLSDKSTRSLTTSDTGTIGRTLNEDGTIGTDTTNSLSENNTNTSTRSLSTTDTGTLNRTLTEGGDVDTNTNDTLTENSHDTDGLTHTLNRSGNIGVTTTQQMIESQRKVLMNMFMELEKLLNEFFFLSDEEDD